MADTELTIVICSTGSGSSESEEKSCGELKDEEETLIKESDNKQSTSSPIPPPRRKKMMSQSTDSDLSDWEMNNFASRTIKSPPMAANERDLSPVSKRNCSSVFKTSLDSVNTEDSESPQKKHTDVTWSPKQFSKFKNNGNINNSLTSGDSALGSSLMSAFGSAFTDSSSSVETTSEGTVSDSGSPVHQSSYGRYTKVNENGERLHSDENDGPVEILVVHRLPGENLGMILGVEGGKERQCPVTGIIVKSVTMGGAAYRATGGCKGICVGDEILKVNGTDLKKLSHDACITIFKEMPLRVTMTIRRGKSGFRSVTKSYSYRINGHPEYSDSEEDSSGNFLPHTITITKKPADSLGLSIVPSYGTTREYYQVKRLLPSGAAFGKLKVGDRLISCDKQGLRGLTQSKCLAILKSASNASEVTLDVLRHRDMEAQMEVTVSKSKMSEVAGCEMGNNFIDPITLHGDLTSTDGETSFSDAESIPKSDFHEVFAHGNVKLAYSAHTQDMSESDSTWSETDPGTDNDAVLIDLCTNESSARTVLNNSYGSSLDQDSTLENSEDLLELHLPPPAEFSDNPPESDTSVHDQESYVPVTNIDDILDEKIRHPAHFQADISMERILDFEKNLLELERECVTSPCHTLTQIEESPWEQEAAESNVEVKREDKNHLVTMETQPDMLNDSIDSENVFIEIDNENNVEGNQFRCGDMAIHGEFVESSKTDINDDNRLCENSNADLDNNVIKLPEYGDIDQHPDNDGMEFVQPIITQVTAVYETGKERNATVTDTGNVQSPAAASHSDQQLSFAETQNVFQKNSNVKNGSMKDIEHVTFPDVKHCFNTDGDALELLSDSDMEYRSELRVSFPSFKPGQHEEKEQRFSEKTLRNSDSSSDKDVACLTLKEKLKFFEESVNANYSEKNKPFNVSHRNLQTSTNADSSKNIKLFTVSHSRNLHTSVNNDSSENVEPFTILHSKNLQKSVTADCSENIKPFTVSYSKNLHTSATANNSENVKPFTAAHSKQELHINPVAVKKSEYSVTVSPQSSLQCSWETKIASHEEVIVPENIKREECERNGCEEKIISKAVRQNYVEVVVPSPNENSSDPYTLLKELSDELALMGQNQTFEQNIVNKPEGGVVKEMPMMAMTAERHESEPPTRTRDLAKIGHIQGNHRNIKSEILLQKNGPPPVVPKLSIESLQRSPQLNSHIEYEPVVSNVIIQNSEAVYSKQPEKIYEENHRSTDSVQIVAEQNNKESSSDIQEDVTVRERIKKINESSLQASDTVEMMKLKADDSKETVNECMFAPVKIQRDTSEIATKQHVSITIPYQETTPDQGEIIIPHILKRQIFDANQSHRIPLDVVDIQNTPEFDNRMRHDISVSLRNNASIKQMEKSKPRHEKKSHVNVIEKSVAEPCIVATDARNEANQYSIAVSLPMKKDHMGSVNSESKSVTITNIVNGDVSKNSSSYGHQISETNIPTVVHFSRKQEINLEPLVIGKDQSDSRFEQAKIDTSEIPFRTSLNVNSSTLSHRKSFPISLSQSATFLPKIKSLTINPQTLAAAPKPFKTTISTDGKILAVGNAGLAPFKLSTQRMSNSKQALGSIRSESSPFQIRVLRGILGLGIEVKTTDDGHVKVIEVKPNGPVAKDGNIRPGDYLVSVNETDLGGLPEKRVHQILLLLPRGLITIIASTKPPSCQPEDIASSAFHKAEDVTAVHTLKKKSASLKPFVHNASPSSYSISSRSAGPSISSRSHSDSTSPSSSISGSSYSFGRKIVTPSSTLPGSTDAMHTDVPVVSTASSVSLRQADKVPWKPPTVSPRTTHLTPKKSPPAVASRLHRKSSSSDDDSIIPAKYDSTNISSSNSQNTVTTKESHSHKNKDDGPIDAIIFASINSSHHSIKPPGSVSATVTAHPRSSGLIMPSSVIDYVQSESEVSSHHKFPSNHAEKYSDSWPRGRNPDIKNVTPIKLSTALSPGIHKTEEEVFIFKPTVSSSGVNGKQRGKNEDVVTTSHSQTVGMSTSAPIDVNVTPILEVETKPERLCSDVSTSPSSPHQISFVQVSQTTEHTPVHSDVKSHENDVKEDIILLSANQAQLSHSLHSTEIVSTNQISSNYNAVPDENTIEIKSDVIFESEHKIDDFVPKVQNGDENNDYSEISQNNELLIDFSLVPLDDVRTENTNQSDFTVDFLNDVNIVEKSSNLDDLLTLTPDVIVSSQTLHDHNSDKTICSSPVSDTISLSKSVSLHAEEPSAIDSMPHHELHAGKSGSAELDVTFQQSDDGYTMFPPQADVIGRASSHTVDDSTVNVNATCDTSDNHSQYLAKNVQENSVQYDLISGLPSETCSHETREITVSNYNAGSSDNFNVDLSLEFPKTDENFNQTDFVKTDDEIYQASTEMSRSGTNELVFVITSKRNWSVVTNTTEDIISGSNNTPLYVDNISNPIVNVICSARIDTLLKQANEILDAVDNLVDDEILVLVLRGADNVHTGIKLTEDSDGKIMISEISERGPFVRKSYLRPGDYLLSLDGVQLFPWELKKAQKAIESSKSEIVLVFAKHLMEFHTASTGLADIAPASRQVSRQDEENLVITDKYDATRSTSVHENGTTILIQKENELSLKPPVSESDISVDIVAKEKMVSDNCGSPRSNQEDNSSNQDSPRNSQNNPRRSDTQDSPMSKGNLEVVDDERTGVFEVTMIKGVTGIGFCIEGGIDSPNGDVPIRIKRIYRGGPAEKCGQLKVKDEIMKVNDMDFTQMRHTEAWQNLRFMAEGPINLLICRN